MKLIQRSKLILEMIKFEHTLFALPFAYLGALLGSIEINHRLPSWSQIGWITLAMIGSRSAAMALNRLIDWKIDAINPRTSSRAIPAGLISIPFVCGFVMLSFLFLFIATLNLNRLTMQLMPIAIFCLVIYSYTKRFTWACHLILGLTVGLGPVGGWIATTGQLDFGTMIILYGTVALWIAGFDVIYACQDIHFDRKEGLYSIPVRFGLKRALTISAWMHVGTVVGLIGLSIYTALGYWFMLAIFISIIILIYEHTIISAENLTRLNTAFFTMNGVLSIIVFIFSLVDLL